MVQLLAEQFLACSLSLWPTIRVSACTPRDLDKELELCAAKERNV